MLAGTDRRRADAGPARPASGFDGGFVEQHHRNIVFHRKDAVAGAALQRCAVLDEGDGCLAIRTGENFQQFWVDGHLRTI